MLVELPSSTDGSISDLHVNIPNLHLIMSSSAPHQLTRALNYLCESVLIFISFHFYVAHYVLPSYRIFVHPFSLFLLCTLHKILFIPQSLKEGNEILIHDSHNNHIHHQEEVR
jgi:hypothetical protein